MRRAGPGRPDYQIIALTTVLTIVGLVAVYSASFFVFWLVSMASSALTHLLGLSSAQVNEAVGPAAGLPGAGPQE